MSKKPEHPTTPSPTPQFSLSYINPNPSSHQSVSQSPPSPPPPKPRTHRSLPPSYQSFPPSLAQSQFSSDRNRTYRRIFIIRRHCSIKAVRRLTWLRKERKERRKTSLLLPPSRKNPPSQSCQPKPRLLRYEVGKVR